MSSEYNNAEIELCFDKINRIRKVDELLRLNADIDFNFVKKYYSRVNKTYRLLHSKEGAMHFSIRKEQSGVSHTEGLSQQAEYIHEIIQDDTKNVLELGCGPGFNSNILAKKKPTVQFTGLDLTPLHIQQAIEASKNLENVSYVEGNFQQLPFENESFDIVFAVETVCHATDMLKVFTEAKRVLRPGGYFVIFDGYGKNKILNANQKIKDTGDLLSLGFAIKRSNMLSPTLELAKKANLKLVENKDLSEAVISNVKSYNDGSKSAFDYPLLMKFFLKIRIVPINIFLHLIAGYVMAPLMKNEFIGYFRLKFQK